MPYTTRFGSLDDYEKGGIELIDDDPKHYAFSNMFEVASASKPYEKVAVGKNMQYVLEVLRAEGTSRVAHRVAHDEFALVMDGEVEIDLVKLDQPVAPAGKRGSVARRGRAGRARRWAASSPRRGHMALLPANSRLPVPRASDPA